MDKFKVVEPKISKSIVQIEDLYKLKRLLHKLGILEACFYVDNSSTDPISS